MWLCSQGSGDEQVYVKISTYTRWLVIGKRFVIEDMVRRKAVITLQSSLEKPCESIIYIIVCANIVKSRETKIYALYPANVNVAIRKNVATHLNNGWNGLTLENVVGNQVHITVNVNQNNHYLFLNDASNSSNCSLVLIPVNSMLCSTGKWYIPISMDSCSRTISNKSVK